MYIRYLLVIALSSIIAINQSLGQQKIKELPSGYFMTVAAYLATGEGYAIRYTNKLKQEGYAADYGFTYPKNMYFVYIKRYNDRNQAISEINSTRRDTPFKDTWVYSYTAINPQDEEPATVITKPEQPPIPPAVTDKEEAPEDSVATPILAEPEDPVVAKPVEPEKPDLSRIIKFRALDARTQKPLAIEATIFDPYEEKVLASLKSGEAMRVPPPQNDSLIARITTNSFGWIKDEASFSFANPINDSTDYFLEENGDTLVITFEMLRMRKGDKQILFNVYFFPNSSIMKPISKYQLNELLTMMEENPQLKIKLHGHTNGTSGGPYTRLAKEDTLFFQLSKVHDSTTGSAKKLSYDRANTIKQFLMYNGIDENRIEVTGWGGKSMIHDENSVAAIRNIRVEVEVLELE